MQQPPPYTPPSGPPQAGPPLLYAVIGKEGLYRLSADCYQRIGRSGIAHLFPTGEALVEASRKQAEFLIGAFGGPPLFVEKHGAPRMRARHLPFVIDEFARDEWLACFRGALGDGSAYGLNSAQCAELLAWIGSLAAWMVNRGG